MWARRQGVDPGELRDGVADTLRQIERGERHIAQGRRRLAVDLAGALEEASDAETREHPGPKLDTIRWVASRPLRLQTVLARL
jgi:hypothetical protein